MFRMNERISWMLLGILVVGIGITGCYAQGPVPIPLPIFSTPADNSSSITPSALLSYENLTYSFKMDYPQDWPMKEAGTNDMNMVVGFLAPGEDMANPSNYVIVQVENLPDKQTLTLDQYGQAVIDNLKKTYPDFNLISTNNIEISNTSAKELVYTLSIDQAPYKETLAYTIQNDKAYIITYYASPDKYLEFEGAVEGMINSFSFF